MEISKIMSMLNTSVEQYESIKIKFEDFKASNGHELPSLENTMDLHGRIDSIISKLKLNFNVKKGQAEYILHSLRELMDNVEILIEQMEIEELKEDERYFV